MHKSLHKQAETSGLCQETTNQCPIGRKAGGRRKGKACNQARHLGLPVFEAAHLDGQDLDKQDVEEGSCGERMNHCLADVPNIGSKCHA